MAELRPHAGLSTRAVHAGDASPVAGGPVATPIFQTSTFFSEPEGRGEVRYTRYGNNPNHSALERKLASLEGAEECAVSASGMAALSCAVLACAAACDHVVAARALYGGTRTLLDRELKRLGIETSYVELSLPGWQQALRPNTRVVLAETPTNPLLRVLDLRTIGEAAHVHGAALLVDATLATPVNLRPLEHGADLVIHSLTKYLGGHSDVTGGAVAGRLELVQEVRRRAQIFGAVLDPHAAWLVERGVKTLSVRMERHNRNGQVVAEWCEQQPGFARVHYPGLESHPDHRLAARLLDGFGGMMSVELRGGGAAADRFVAGLRLAKVAPSLGGVETLVSEPRHTSHAGLPQEEREAIGIHDGLVRFSLGIEDAEDLIADIEGALREL
ncbi:PLP-dependent aspartate aminotransferase family protein [soil metagenome]